MTQEPSELEIENYEGNYVDFLNHGINYVQSAFVLNKNIKDLEVHKFASIYFCIVHSCELFLKAFLLDNGFTHKQLRKTQIRHNLEALLKEAEKLGLKISSEHELQLANLNKYSKKHEFRYPYMGGKFLQEDINYLIQISMMLHAQISTLIKSKKEAA